MNSSGDVFANRHIGSSAAEVDLMLSVVGAADLDEFVARVVPASIRSNDELAIPSARTEVEVIRRLRELADRNVVATSLIGTGYYGTVMPPVLQRNVLENPAWYTAYTPYQPEISQGRLEALLNFQTMVCDLTGLELANASLLDEATAAAEAMALAHRMGPKGRDTFFVDVDTHPQTIAVLRTRAEPVGIALVVGDPTSELNPAEVFGALLSYPGSSGEIGDIGQVIDRLHATDALAVVATDLLALVLLESPGRLGADIAIGSTQRFGVPMGFGGPHAAFLVTRERFARSLPGRLVGVSSDGAGRRALRLALQTREQHIRREKATSNICTAQVLLAVLAGLYATWHGPDGLRRIAGEVHSHANRFAAALRDGGVDVVTKCWFDTLTIRTDQAREVWDAARRDGINLRLVNETTLGVSFDETSTDELVDRLCKLFGVAVVTTPAASPLTDGSRAGGVRRSDAVLAHPVFSTYRSEHAMLRYLRRLADMDLAMDRTMIPLGSCTMKLNATTEMLAITWPEFANIHPHAPDDQTAGYRELISELEGWLAECTGYAAVSLQPNAGSQGELAGLLAIKGYHESRGEAQRTVCLIPSSAHGTNAASAVMAGMSVVVVACDQDGNVDVDDLRARAEANTDRLAAVMVTYPSTHGVFETAITEICDIVHQHGGQVYVDGANLNALVGLARPGRFGGDVSHLNLHKTFCIPHGGGGPGVGPVTVGEHLRPFLPGNPTLDQSGSGAVSAAPFGSAGILPISWAYIALMGPDGLRQATVRAILHANYLARRLDPYYPVLYRGEHGDVAHECIIDLRPITKTSGVTVEDVAKRLIDYGFHSPTMSFPVAGTLMIEPTESEGLAELDRFVDAMISIRSEIDRVADGTWPADDNPLVNAPHTAAALTADDWSHPYSRSTACYPLDALREAKYFAPVGRIDGGKGDRNLICTCPPLDSYMTEGTQP